jgi:hypothetical protein
MSWNWPEMEVVEREKEREIEREREREREKERERNSTSPPTRPGLPAYSISRLSQLSHIPTARTQLIKGSLLRLIAFIWQA